MSWITRSFLNSALALGATIEQRFPHTNERLIRGSDCRTKAGLLHSNEDDGAHARIRTGDLFLTKLSSVPGEYKLILGAQATFGRDHLPRNCCRRQNSSVAASRPAMQRHLSEFATCQNSRSVNPSVINLRLLVVLLASQSLCRKTRFPSKFTGSHEHH